ncbi:MAG: NAD-dependent epimerase/dehydratase family protein [Thermoanaerobaculia bacterium]
MKTGMARKNTGGGRVVSFPKARGAAVRRPKIVVTGGAGFFGARLVRALLARGHGDVVVFDLVPPADMPGDVRHRFLDLNLPFADGTLYKLLLEEKPDVIVHLAQLRSPSHQTTYAHELNSIGALHVFAAAGEAKVPRVILGSTSLVYGARGDNPNFLTEEHPLRCDPQDRFVRDFVEAESHAREHVRRHPETAVQILRFVPLLSPEVRDYRAKLFASPVSWTLMGYDPLIQALHPDDAVEALLHALERPEVRGVFNVAPEGILPLSSVRLFFGSVGIPVPHALAYALYEASWLAGIGIMPGVHAHYLRYLCVVSNDKARTVLGCAPRRTTLDCVLETARARFGNGRLVDFDVLADAAKAADFAYERRVHPRRASIRVHKEAAS